MQHTTYALSLVLLLSVSAQTFSMQQPVNRLAAHALQRRLCSTQVQSNTGGNFLWRWTKRLALFTTGYAVGFTNGVFSEGTITSTIDDNTKTTKHVWDAGFLKIKLETTNEWKSNSSDQ
jgi:hypothetical protein